MGAAIAVSAAVSSLGSTTVMFVIFSCPRRNRRTIALIADFVGWEAGRISATAMIAGCVLTHCCSTITTARPESTCQTAPFVRKIFSQAGMRAMKCPVDTPSTGIASRNSRRTIPDVPSARRLPKRRNTWHRRGQQSLWGSRSSRSLPTWLESSTFSVAIARNQMRTGVGIS